MGDGTAAEMDQSRRGGEEGQQLERYLLLRHWDTGYEGIGTPKAIEQRLNRGMTAKEANNAQRDTSMPSRSCIGSTLKHTLGITRRKTSCTFESPSASA